MALHDDARKLAGDLTELRHGLHREPEVGLQLPRTQEKVLAALDGLPLEISTGTALSSVTAVLRGARPGPTVLLRGDMDALPVTERTGLPYASAADGVMHACGHDLHTTMLAGAAQLLAARRDELAGNVVFMFQPGEEGWFGARHMIEEGVLDAAGDRPAAAYALHVVSAYLPPGMAASKPGPVLASADTLRVTVRGRGGHGSMPHHAADPIPVACEIVTALQTLVTRRFDIFDPVVLTVGSFHAGTTDNVIPDDARFEATVRSFSAAARATMQDASVRLARDIAAAHGLSADVDYSTGYPVTVNNPDEVAFAGKVATGLFGPGQYVTQPNPVGTAEDFSYVLERVPGAFVLVGACPPDRAAGDAPFNHSAEAVFDDDAIPGGAALYAELALQRLARG